MNYYNEFDKSAAEWLRQLIEMGAIPKGEVDERSIEDVTAGDLRGFVQCHFFCGIAGWPEALRRAGVPATRPLWTGSCPCQDFSHAGKQEGVEGDRDLWPEFFRLIRECRPVRVLGEQVSAAIGHGWLDRLSTDLEKEGYAVGATVLGAHSAGADHQRQRLYWVADADAYGRRETGVRVASTGNDGVVGNRSHVGLADTEGSDRRRELEAGTARGGRSGLAGGRDACELADSETGGFRENGSAQRQGGHASQRDTVGGLENPSCVGRRGRNDGDSTEHGGTLQVEVSSGACRMGDTPSDEQLRMPEPGCDGERFTAGRPSGADGAFSPLGDSASKRLQERDGIALERQEPCGVAERPGEGCGVSGPFSPLVDAICERGCGGKSRREDAADAGQSGQARNFWSDAIAIPCRDNCVRRAESGIFPLVAKLPRGVGYSGDPRLPSYANNTAEARVMRLKGYGNAINVETAKLFIEAVEEIMK